MMNAGLPLAFSNGLQPWHFTPSGNMNFVVATACIKMKMTSKKLSTQQLSTVAYAMGISKTHGSITKGKKKISSQNQS